MAERSSALEGHYHPGAGGAPGDAGVILQEIPGLVLHQVAAWPDRLDAAAKAAAKSAGTEAAPGPGRAEQGAKGALLRVEPLKWWLYGAPAAALDPQTGTTLDLSHSSTHIRVSGPAAADMLMRHLPLDLREQSFPEGSVAASGFHHVGVTLWRSADGCELFIPRGFALSLWHLLLASSEQFGLNVV